MCSKALVREAQTLSKLLPQEDDDEANEEEEDDEDDDEEEFEEIVEEIEEIEEEEEIDEEQNEESKKEAEISQTPNQATTEEEDSKEEEEKKTNSKNEEQKKEEPKKEEEEEEDLMRVWDSLSTDEEQTAGEMNEADEEAELKYQTHLSHLPVYLSSLVFSSVVGNTIIAHSSLSVVFLPTFHSVCSLVTFSFSLIMFSSILFFSFSPL